MKTDSGQKLWGVTHVPEKRKLRHNVEERLWNLEDPETTQKAYYMVRLRLLGKQRYVGSTALRRTAARLYDSALFHLWGFAHRPKCRFNEWSVNQSPPEFFPEVRRLQTELIGECRRRGLDESAFLYTFLERSPALT